MHDQFGDGAADGRRLLDAVAREAGGEDQALDLGMPADDAVLVEGIVLVIARPAIVQSAADAVAIGEAGADGFGEDAVFALATSESGVQNFTAGKTVRKRIFVPDKLLNIVVG